MRLGDFEIRVVSDGYFHLDGGAMFGTVPRVLWEKTDPPDERHRVRLGLNCLLVRAPEATILIDTGMGPVPDEKFAFLYGVDRQHADLSRSLEAAGARPQDITHVVLTHLHFDHVGGACHPDADGQWQPAFPNATYYIDAGELGCARAPDRRSRASYLPHTWEPLVEGGRLALTQGDDEIVPGLRVHRTPGHTRHHQIVLLGDGEQTCCFLADLVPTPSHLKTHYVMGYDLYPVESMENKERILAQAQREEWLLVFEHAARVHAGYVRGEAGLEPVDLNSESPRKGPNP